MAVCSVYPLNPNLLSHSFALSLSHHSHAYWSVESVSRIRRNGRKGSMTVRVLSTHSNAKILNPKRKSRYGHTFSLYDTDIGLDDWLLDVSFCFTLPSLPFNFYLPCLSLCLVFCLQMFFKTNLDSQIVEYWWSLYLCVHFLLKFSNLNCVFILKEEICRCKEKKGLISLPKKYQPLDGYLVDFISECHKSDGFL